MGSNIDVSSTGALVNRLMNPPNPMQQLQQTVEGVNALKSFQANQASADAYRQSVDPVTGEVDLGKYKALMSQGPGAWNFGPQTQQAGQAVGAVGQGTTADIGAKMRQVDAIGQMMFPLLRDGAATQSIDPARVQSQLDQAHATHLITDQQYQAWSNQIKGMTGPEGAKQAYGFVLGANEGNEGARAFLSPSIYNYGGGGVNINPSSPGGVTAGTVIPHTLSPGEMIGTTSVPIGNNQSATVPSWVAAQGGEAIRQWLEATKPPGYTPGSYQPAPATGGGTAPGRYPQPVAPATPAAPSPGSPSGANAPLWLQPPPRGPLPSEAGGPGVTPTTQYSEGVSGTTRKAADAAGSLSTQAGETQNTIATLNDMERTLNQPGVTTGVGAQSVTGFRQLLMNAGIVPKDSAAPDLSTAQGAQEEFNKDSALLQKSQLGTIGNPTDARQDLVAEATPGSALSKTGNLGIIRMLRGNQQAINVMNDAWNQARQKAGWTAGGSEANNFNTWRTQFLAPDKATDGGKFDSRVFWIANAPTIAEQREYAATIPKEQQQQFLKNLAYATNMGWVAKGADGSVQLQGQ